MRKLSFWWKQKKLTEKLLKTIIITSILIISLTLLNFTCEGINVIYNEYSLDNNLSLFRLNKLFLSELITPFKLLGALGIAVTSFLGYNKYLIAVKNIKLSQLNTKLTSNQNIISILRETVKIQYTESYPLREYRKKLLKYSRGLYHIEDLSDNLSDEDIINYLRPLINNLIELEISTKPQQLNYPYLAYYFNRYTEEHITLIAEFAKNIFYFYNKKFNEISIKGLIEKEISNKLKDFINREEFITKYNKSYKNNWTYPALTTEFKKACLDSEQSVDKNT